MIQKWQDLYWNQMTSKNGLTWLNKYLHQPQKQNGQTLFMILLRKAIWSRYEFVLLLLVDTQVKVLDLVSTFHSAQN